MKKALCVFALLLLVTACKTKQPYNTDKLTSTKPNVILFLVDDLGWTDGGVFGSDLYQTPNIDKLASEGMLFTNGYAACTVCSPTRASIMTGKYPAKLHLTDWITGHERPYAKLQIPNWNEKLDLEEITLAEVFKQKGYNTVHIGKWHLGEDEKYWPENQGFDKNIGGFSAGSPKGDGGKGYFSPYGNPRLKDGFNGEYLTERLADEAVTYIKQNKEHPFFMNYWLYNVHMPLQAKKDKIEKYKKLIKEDAHHINPTYAAMVEHMDDALGNVMTILKETGLEDNTIIVFYSDNGGLVGNNGRFRLKITDNFPLRSGKGDMYEGGVRVPLIFKWPHKIKAGTVNSTIAISPDLFPTLLNLVDKNTIMSPDIDGIDLSSVLLENTELERSAIYWHYPHYHAEGAQPYSAIRKGDWKLIQIFENNEIELFNLKEDLGETNNVASQYPEKTKELLSNLENWRVTVMAQMPTPNKNYNPEKEALGSPKK